MESYSIEINIPLNEKDSDAIKDSKYIPHIFNKLCNIKTFRTFNFTRTESYLFLDIHFNEKKNPEIISEVKIMVRNYSRFGRFETIIHEHTEKDVPGQQKSLDSSLLSGQSN